MTWSQKRFVLCYLFVTIIIIYFHNSYHTFCSSFLVICAWEASLTRIWCNEHWNVLHPSPWSGTLCLKCRFWALKCPRTPPRCNPLVLSQSACVCACLPEGFFRQESVCSFARLRNACPTFVWQPWVAQSWSRPSAAAPNVPVNRLIKLFWSPALPRLPSGLHLSQLF